MRPAVALCVRRMTLCVAMRTKHRPALELAQERTGGQLADLLRDWRTAGHSWDTISRTLWAEHRVSVTRQTLVVWATWLGVEPERVAS